jgi:Ca2+-transporting ATPase
MRGYGLVTQNLYDSETGLSNSQVLARQKNEGPNNLPSSKPKKIHSLILDILSEPMVYLLISCGVIYFILGDPQEAFMLVGFLLLIIAITIFQKVKAERALEALRDLSAPLALVVREGKEFRVPGIEVVREDTILLCEGDRVPADAKLIKSNQIEADESLLTGESAPVQKSVNQLIYAGTTIVRGQGRAIVQAIGSNTQMGKIGKSLMTRVHESSPLEIQTRNVVKKVSWPALIICLSVIVSFGMLRQDWISGSLVGITLAMAILPNEIPAALTIFLALGAWRMSQKRVLTRKISAIENLGAATVLCVDKTGTLTMNQMRIQTIFSQNKMIDLTKEKSEKIPEEFHEALEFGILACRQNPFDPMELAFLSAGDQFLFGTEHLHRDWHLEKEYPISPTFLSLSHAWKPSSQGDYIIGAKGAPEAIIDLCHLPKEKAQMALKIVNDMASRGLRVLGVAKSKSPPQFLPPIQHDLNFDFIGLIGIADPIRKEVPKAISECRSAGIRVIMITGDHPSTARQIANKIGIENSNLVLTGQELEQMKADEFITSLKNINIFSRVTPDQKLQIVNGLKENGEIVAMTGDGVNDAPALKSAHIGIAMGKRGTDVAREAASLVLLDDDFGSIIEAIKMGRRVYDNFKRTLIYLSSAHIPIAGMSIIPIIFDMPIVLLPAHIALLHLIIEPASSIAFEVEPARETIMSDPPRDPNQGLINTSMVTSVALQGISILLALIVVFFITMRSDRSEEQARTNVFMTLMVSNLMLIFLNVRSDSSILKRLFSRKNKVTNLIVLGSVLMFITILYVPALRQVLKLSVTSLIDVVTCIILGFISVFWIKWMPKKFS